MAPELTLPEANAAMLCIRDLYRGVASAHAERLPRKPTVLEAAIYGIAEGTRRVLWLAPNAALSRSFLVLESGTRHRLP